MVPPNHSARCVFKHLAVDTNISRIPAASYVPGFHFIVDRGNLFIHTYVPQHIVICALSCYALHIMQINLKLFPVFISVLAIVFFSQPSATQAYGGPVITCPGKPASTLAWSSTNPSSCTGGFTNSSSDPVCNFNPSPNGTVSGIPNGTSCNVTINCLNSGGTVLATDSASLVHHPELVWNGSACVPPANTATTPPIETPPSATSCSYDSSIYGPVTWAANGNNCSQSSYVVSGVASGDSVTVYNNASGYTYTSSATYKCTEGQWSQTSASCTPSSGGTTCVPNQDCLNAVAARFCPNQSCEPGCGLPTRWGTNTNKTDCPSAVTGGTGSVGGSSGTGSTPPPPPKCIPRGGIYQRQCSGLTFIDYDNCGGEIGSTQCLYGCSAHACEAPKRITTSTLFIFKTHGGLIPTFTTNGDLKVKPVLVKRDSPTWLYWNVENAAYCTVSGTNGDSWPNISSSGPDGKKSGLIKGHTVFTLHCEPLPWDGPPTSPPLIPLTQTQAVDIAPIFLEPRE